MMDVWFDKIQFLGTFKDYFLFFRQHITVEDKLDAS